MHVALKSVGSHTRKPRSSEFRIICAHRLQIPLHCMCRPSNPPSIRAVFISVCWLILCLESFSAAMINSESLPQMRHLPLEGDLHHLVEINAEEIKFKNPPTCSISCPPENASPDKLLSSCASATWVCFPLVSSQTKPLRFTALLSVQFVKTSHRTPADFWAGSRNKACLCVVWCLCSASHPLNFHIKFGKVLADMP